ncbi:MAG: hypothetical protein KKB59_10565 [Spirochaetes bacterium]|nr:hypothetical protein [Spirochaetota bacterium]
MFSMFREAPLPDGKPGPVSMRRILALFFSLAAVALFFSAIPGASAGWYGFIPGGLCLVAALALLFLTTAGDIATVISAARKS